MTLESRFKGRKGAEWMLALPRTDRSCDRCGTQMRDHRGQIVCLSCWEWATRINVERARYALIAYERKLAAANEPSEEEDGLRYCQDWAADKSDWEMVLHYKWRAAVVETTGLRPPMGEAVAL